MSDTPKTATDIAIGLFNEIGPTRADAMIYELRRELTAEKERSARLERALEVRSNERDRAQAGLDIAIAKLTRIMSLIQGPDIVLPNGERYSFDPPDDLVRFAWRELSNEIREAALGDSNG